MPSWWGKSSSKEAKRKVKRGSIIDTIQQKFKKVSEEECNDKSRRCRRHCVDIDLEKGSRTAVPSRSPSPHVSRCQSFERPLSQPLPLPGLHLPTVSDVNSGVSLTPTPERVRCSKPSQFPLPKPGDVSNRGYAADASFSSDSSIDGGDSPDSHVVSPLATDCENRNRSSTINSCFRLLHKDQSPITVQKNSRAPSSPKWGRLHLHNLKIPGSCGLCSTPLSSSPSTSPMRTHGPDQVLNSALWTGKPHRNIASGQCSCTGSGHNSGGDLPRQVCVPQNRCSPECSPIPSPRMTSPGPSSRIQSGVVTPLHPRTGAIAAEMAIRCPEDVKQQSHRLPLPPITATNSSPFSANYSTPTTPPSAPRSPIRAENPTSQGSRWKKGKLLGRGTFGHVYLGFDRESGEMCAMKEVTLFADDAKSKECAQQLGQEIALLSRLRHPNIVRYYGSETVDDKLYIYLEYVSGGSIYKLLQEYGQLGEIAIRSYTRQILSGLAYLHAKNTVHRDIKGANILVDPNGCIKLADFGMAKYITGSDPFSFKGSPYWMAPEVIKNSNGCNIAVDIWSLGCTVLEMATTKPPWSQFEGVAAMFKVLQARGIPEIPDHLSEDGKDFVRLCLQRNPQNRPSAAQLLEHPFVKKVTPERSVMAAYPSKAQSAVVDALRSMAIGPAKHKSCLELELADIYPLRSLRNSSRPSDTHTPRNISSPVSPVRDLLLPSRTPDATGTVPPSPIASPSTPVTSGGGAISSFNKRKQPIILSHEAVSMNQKPQGGFYHQEPKHDPLRRPPHASRVLFSPDYDALANHNHHRRVVLGSPTEFHNVPQQLLRDYVRPNNPLDRKASNSMLGKINGL